METSSLTGFCGNKDCENKLPDWPNAKVYQLPEEAGLNPPIWYCSLECSVLARVETYEPKLPARRRCW